MKYVSGQIALNISCSLDTCGDWHRNAINWSNLKLRDSSSSPLANWGIEEHYIEELNKNMMVANTIRACLDLLSEGSFCAASGMNQDYICNENYDEIVFNQAMKLQVLPNWNKIEDFLSKEYKMKWINYKKGCDQFA